jgi:3-oxoacyl-[acyl-carrier protein] reductase
MVAEVLEQAGRVDILVNNAAIQREALLVDQTLDDFRAVVDTNLLGTFLCSRAVLPSMLERGSGVIVNMSSVLGLVGDAMLPVYSATKHAIQVSRARSPSPTPAGHSMRRHLPWRR